MTSPDAPDAPPPPGEDGEPLAAWWRRLIAFLLDTAIVGATVYLAWIALGGGVPDAGDPPPNGLVYSQLGASLAYFGFLNGGARGQTLGKVTLRIQVRDAATYGPLGYPRGLARYAFIGVLLAILGPVPVIVDGMWALFDKRRQTFHDKLVSSVVLDAAPVPAVEDS